MTRQHPINLAPSAERLEVLKITYPPIDSRRVDWILQPMRFIPHDGKAKG